MVEETIKTIKETESEAEEILKAADVTCTSILEKAAASANEIKEQAEEKAEREGEMRRLAQRKMPRRYFYQGSARQGRRRDCRIEKSCAGKRKRSN